MDYSQLSDLEINQRVSNAIPGRFIFYPDYVWDSEWEKTFDPCNNPADAWPIIVDNEISLNSYSGTWEASYEYDAPIGAFGTDELVTKAVEGKNPLRTAMIAFLMKREHSNA